MTAAIREERKSGGLSRRRFCAGLAAAPLLASGAAASAAGGEPPRKWAVLVGVSALHYTPSKSLVGPRNDVPQIRAALTGKYGFTPENVAVLENEQSTRANILRALQTIAASARPDDFVLFYYSGHGVLCPPPANIAGSVAGASPDALYKAFVPHDAQLSHGKRLDNGQPCPGLAIGCEGGDKCEGGDPLWNTLLAYHDVSALLRGLPTKNVLVLLDCCHSGIAARGGAVARRWISVKSPAGGAASPSSGSAGSADTLEGLTTLTACSAQQTAKEWAFLAKDLGESAPNAGKMGALTYYLMEALRGDTQNTLTGTQAFAHVSAALLASDFNQTPEAEGYLSRPLFGVVPPLQNPLPPADRDAALVVSVQNGTVRLKSAAVSEGGLLLPDSVWTSDGKAGASPAVVRITDSQGVSATGRVVSGTVRAGLALHETLRPLRDGKMRVAVLNADISASVTVTDAARELTRLLTALPYLTLVTASTAPREIEVEVSAVPGGGGLSATLYRAQTRLPEVWTAPTAGEMAQKITPTLQNLAALQTLLDLKNDGAGWSIDAQVNGQSAATVAVGSQIALTVRADRPCYLYVVDVDPQGKVTVLFPNRFVRDNHLQANQTYALPAPQMYRLTVQGPAGPEVIKAIATLAPLSLPALSADTGEFTALGEGAAAFTARLTRELRQAVNAEAGGRNEQLIARAGWAAATVFLRVASPA